MEMSGYDCVASLPETGISEFSQDGDIVPFNLALMMTFPAYPGHPIRYGGNDAHRHIPGNHSGQRIMKQEPEEMVADIPSVDLVTVAKVNTLASQIDSRRPPVNPGIKGLLEKPAHMEVVVPFKVDEFGPARRQLPELFQDREIVGKGNLATTNPELEQITEDEEGVGITL